MPTRRTPRPTVRSGWLPASTGVAMDRAFAEQLYRANSGGGCARAAATITASPRLQAAARLTGLGYTEAVDLTVPASDTNEVGPTVLWAEARSCVGTRQSGPRQLLPSIRQQTAGPSWWNAGRRGPPHPRLSGRARAARASRLRGRPRSGVGEPRRVKRSLSMVGSARGRRRVSAWRRCAVTGRRRRRTSMPRCGSAWPSCRRCTSSLTRRLCRSPIRPSMPSPRSRPTTRKLWRTSSRRFPR
jgi:hypothetical protein